MYFLQTHRICVHKQNSLINIQKIQKGTTSMVEESRIKKLGILVKISKIELVLVFCFFFFVLFCFFICFFETGFVYVPWAVLELTL